MTPHVRFDQRYLIRRHSAWIQAILLVIAAVTGGYWVNILTGDHGHLGAIGWSNLWLIISVASVLGQLSTARVEVKSTRQDAENAISDLLEVAARALVFPRDWTTVQIRAHCYKYNPSKDCLMPVAHRSSHEHADNWKSISCDARHQKRFVIVKSVRKVADINEEFLERNALEREVGVWEELHTVLAAPIRVVDDETHVIGIVNFDSSLHEDEIRFSTPQAHDIAVIAARAVARLWRSDFTPRSAR